MGDGNDVVAVVARSQPGKNGPRFGFVFIGIRFKVDPNRIVSEKNLRHSIEELSILSLQAFAFRDYLFSRSHTLTIT